MHRPGLVPACLLSTLALAALAPAAPAEAARSARAAEAERVLAKHVRQVAREARRVTCRTRGARRWGCRWSGTRRLGSGALRTCRGTAVVRRTRRRWRVRRSEPRCVTRSPVAAPRRPAGDAEAIAVPAPSPADTRPTLHFGFSETPDGRLPLEKHAGLALGAGADSQRLTLGWNWAEPVKDDYRLSGFDQLYNASVSRGIRPVITILFSPSWTWAPEVDCPPMGWGCTYPPDARFDSEWREFVALVAARYPQALAFEIWNEPNLRVFWKPLPDVDRYSQLLEQAYTTIKSVDPSAEVITGGFADPSDTTTGDISLADFTRGVYERGGKNYMDGIGFHPYGAVLGTEFVERAFRRVRDVRDAFGDQERPLWATEFGLTTTGDPWPRVWTEAEQAVGLTAHYQAIASMPDVKAAFIHTLVEPQGSRDGIGPGYGLVRGDGTPKPAFCAIAVARGRPGTCD